MPPEFPLKDIHLPDPVGWWPPAIGWWLLAVLLPLTIYGIWRLYRRATRFTALKSARKTLTAIRQMPADPAHRLEQLSILLRRVCISSSQPSHYAAMTGEKWLAYLDLSMPDKPFSNGCGRILADGHYRRTAPTEAEVDAVTALCERWLKRQKA